MLFLIGLGVNPLKHLTLEALKAIDGCKKLYLETYTSTMPLTLQELKRFLDEKLARDLIIIGVDRAFVEEGSKKLIEEASHDNIGLLVIGDALSATTHYGLVLEAISKGVQVSIVHGLSILTVVSRVGIDLYKFGRVVTLVKPNNGFRFTSPLDQIRINLKVGLHTLILLDMSLTVKTALKQLFSLKQIKETNIIVCSRLCWDDEIIKIGRLQELLNSDAIQNLKPPLCIIIPGAMNDFEKDALNKIKATAR